MAPPKFKLHLVLHSAKLVERLVHDRLEPLGIRPRQALVLDALSIMGPVSQADLARQFRITAPSMSTMTARLVAGGFIERMPDPDLPGANILRLAAPGEALLDDIRAAWADVDAQIEAAIGADAADGLATHAKALRDALGGRAPGRAKTRQHTAVREDR